MAAPRMDLPRFVSKLLTGGAAPLSPEGMILTEQDDEWAVADPTTSGVSMRKLGEAEGGRERHELVALIA